MLVASVAGGYLDHQPAVKAKHEGLGIAVSLRGDFLSYSSSVTSALN
jgi:hypothetical protein